jgi:hypothetical protein
LAQVSVCLPPNYRAHENADGSIEIVGYDRFDMTLDDYVLPSLAHAMIFAEEFHGSPPTPKKARRPTKPPEPPAVS